MFLTILAQQAQQPSVRLVFIAAIAAALVIFVLAIAILLIVLRPWLKGFMSGFPVSVFDVIGMRFRRSPINEIMAQGVALAHAGCPVSSQELERAAIAGADLEKVGMAYITARERELPYSSQELVGAERESRLNDLLK